MSPSRSNGETMSSRPLTDEDIDEIARALVSAWCLARGAAERVAQACRPTLGSVTGW